MYALIGEPADRAGSADGPACIGCVVVPKSMALRRSIAAGHRCRPHHRQRKAGRRDVCGPQRRPHREPHLPARAAGVRRPHRHPAPLGHARGHQQAWVHPRRLLVGVARARTRRALADPGPTRSGPCALDLAGPPERALPVQHGRHDSAVRNEHGPASPCVAWPSPCVSDAGAPRWPPDDARARPGCGCGPVRVRQRCTASTASRPAC